MEKTGRYQKRINTHNTDYWDKYYKKVFHKKPSDFAIFCLNNYITENQMLIDVGCGCAQDSLFFFKNNLQVTSIDRSKIIIDKLRNKYKKYPIAFESGDITKYLPCGFDIVYARWVLHAMPWISAISFLEKSYKSLSPNGKLFIECRSSKDKIIKKDHYRNLIEIKELEKQIKILNMKIIFLSEKRGWSKRKNGDDPLLIRLIAKK